MRESNDENDPDLLLALLTDAAGALGDALNKPRAFVNTNSTNTNAKWASDERKDSEGKEQLTAAYKRHENYNDDDEVEEAEEEEEEEEEEEDEDDDEQNDDDEDDEELEDGVCKIAASAVDTVEETCSPLAMDTSSQRCTSSNLEQQQHYASMLKSDESSLSLNEPALSSDDDEEAATSTRVEVDESTSGVLTPRERQLAANEWRLVDCDEYRTEIVAYMRALEQTCRPRANYMRRQQDITDSMRAILVDWLVEVSEEYKLSNETLHLAVNYTDRFLSNMSVLRGKLQLVGTASIYLASKYEEITPPDIAEFVYITDDTYTRKQVLRMEHIILKVLEFRLSAPTANWFLQYFLRYISAATRSTTATTTCNKAQRRIGHLAAYAAELALIDGERFLAYVPSQIASAALYLAYHVLGKQPSKHALEVCEYALDSHEMRSCMGDLHAAVCAAPTHPQQAVYEKYRQDKYDRVALIDPAQHHHHYHSTSNSTSTNTSSSSSSSSSSCNTSKHANASIHE